MTQREIVRTAIVLGGLWLIFSGFGSLSSIFDSLLDGARGTDSALTENFGNLLLVSLLTGLLGIVMTAGPGIYAISSAERWAERLTPSVATKADVQPSLVLAVGAMLLGLSMGVSASVSLAASGATLILQTINDDLANILLVGMMIDRALYSAFSLLAGILLFRWGSRSVLRAA